MIFIGIYVISSLVTFVVVAGLEFANFQRRYPHVATFDYENDRNIAFKLGTLAAVFGPIGMILPFCGKYPCKHGWLWPAKKRFLKCAR